MKTGWWHFIVGLALDLALDGHWLWFIIIVAATFVLTATFTSPQSWGLR